VIGSFIVQKNLTNGSSLFFNILSFEFLLEIFNSFSHKYSINLNNCSSK